MRSLSIPDPKAPEAIEEWTAAILDNVTYFTISFRKNLRGYTFKYPSLDEARTNARFAAQKLKKPVLIYAVACPYEDATGLCGYTVWVETAPYP